LRKHTTTEKVEKNITQSKKTYRDPATVRKMEKKTYCDLKKHTTNQESRKKILRSAAVQKTEIKKIP
jgi:hypothetical protein